MTNRLKRRRLLGDVGLYAAVAGFVVFALFPIYWTLKISVTPSDLLYSQGVTAWPTRATLRNYVGVLEATDFPRYFLNSTLVSASTSLVVTIIASAAGYAFSRFRFRGKQVVAFVLLLTQTFPLVMVIPPIYRIMGSLHLTNSLTGLVIIYVAFNIPFATFLMQSFCDGVPRDLEEAALIDGGTRLP
jgi:multiple sugar transport system permease protein